MDITDLFLTYSLIFPVKKKKEREALAFSVTEVASCQSSHHFWFTQMSSTGPVQRVAYSLVYNVPYYSEFL